MQVYAQLFGVYVSAAGVYGMYVCAGIYRCVWHVCRHVQVCAGMYRLCGIYVGVVDVYRCLQVCVQVCTGLWVHQKERTDKHVCAAPHSVLRRAEVRPTGQAR